MSRVEFEFEGLPELLTALRRLPRDLVDEASRIMDGHGAAAEAEIRNNYQAHAHTGKLADSVERRTVALGPWGHSIVIRAKAKHAHLFEHGTNARHHSQGRYVGIMPPAPPMHQFIPAMERQRRAMYRDLRDLLTSHGLEVTGSAG